MPNQQRGRRKHDSGRMGAVTGTVRLSTAKSRKNRLNVLLVCVISLFIGVIGLLALASVIRGEPGDCELYFVNARGGLEPVTVALKAESAGDRLVEAIALLRAGSASSGLSGSVPDYVGIDKVEVSLDMTALKVHFTPGYAGLEIRSDLMCRAALARTLTSLDSYETVEFYIGGEPMMSAAGEPIGGLSAGESLLLDRDALSSVQNVDVTLYFAGTGDALGKLVPEVRTIQVDSQRQTGELQRAVVQELIKGPDAESEGLLPLLPASAAVQSISPDQSGNWSLSLNGDFLTQLAVSGVNQELAVYSIINSLTKLQGVNRVQIYLDGVRVEEPRGGAAVDIYPPLESRPELNLE